MILRDITRPDSRFFIKSEWGPASNDWPAVSFSKQAVGRKMRGIYDPARDFVIYVGTTNPRNTPNAQHRSRLLSVVRMDLRSEYKTRDLIPPESWAQAQAEHGDRWMYAFALLAAWDLDQLPSAYDYIPKTYSSLRNPVTFGDFVEVDSSELQGLSELSIKPVALMQQASGWQAVTRATYFAASKTIKEMIRSMAFRVEERQDASGTSSIRRHPGRIANPRFETEEMLFNKWEQQKGFCGLCQQLIPVPCTQGLLQPSPDRIDSLSPSYFADNVHITHLGCNLAKNKFDVDRFEEWLEVVRGASS